MLNKLRKLNKSLKVYSIFDPEFSSYGRVVEGISTEEIVKVGESIERCNCTSAYIPSCEEFEALDISKIIEDELFGFLPTQVGYCHGRNSYLNAAEWHTSSEINIAVTDLVLLLAHTYEIEDGRISADVFKAFFVPRGACIEVFATSLHFCPCEVSESGFGCVVALPRGTNTPLECTPECKLMFRKNKWIVAHEENEALIGRGVVPGIYGENYKILY